MPRDTYGESGGVIGPNAILQLIPVLEDELGSAGCAEVLTRAGARIPSGDHMIPEGPAAALHAEVRRTCGPRANGVMARAGRGTARYILAHRIPTPVQALLRALPAGPAARLLSRAIAQNAWTFAGSGAFAVMTPWRFTVTDNPLVRGETGDHTLCVWHAAVFETLYRALVHPAARCREVACSAEGEAACVFEITI